MKLGTYMVDRAAGHHRIVLVAVLVVTLATALVAALPSVWPEKFASLNGLRVDTDPENMLAEDEPVRVFHDRMKDRFDLNDMVVVGVVNTEHEDGVFNPRSLGRVYELTEFAKTLRWPGEDGEVEGVILRDIISPSTVDNIEPGAEGEISFNYMMPEPPETPEQARAVLENSRRIPFLNGTMISEEGNNAVALYLPITDKDVSSRIYDALNRRIPVLWVWAPLASDIAEAMPDAPEQAKVLQDLGRLAAHQANDVEEFKTFFASFAGELAENGSRGEGWQAAATAVEDWAGADEGTEGAEAGPNALEQDDPLAPTPPAETEQQSDPAAMRASQEAVEELREHLHGRAETSEYAPYLRLVEYYVASRAGIAASGAELAEAAKAFARGAGESLSGDAESFEKLPEVVEKSFAANSGMPGGDEYHITGLPVAEDVFGVEMFIQMGISAPAAMVVIFLLMLLFFRKLVVIISPLLLALVTVVITMSALVISGFPVHIMSSMIPIFIMPIAVLDSVHIISEFFEHYQQTKDRRETIRRVMDALFMPMLYTSLTSSAGFASLALTPIPPVQVFGLYVALGVMLAWLLTMTFIPAFVMLIPPKMLENFGTAVHGQTDDPGEKTRIGRVLKYLGGATYRRAKPIVALAVVVMIIAGYGISRIRINDNPIKWFTKSHPIRVADRVLNDELGGTYMAYLSLEAGEREFDADQTLERFTAEANRKAEELSDQLPGSEEVFATLVELARDTAADADSAEQFYDELSAAVADRRGEAEGLASFAWDEAANLVEYQRQSQQVFKQPEYLEFMLDLQRKLAEVNRDGKQLVGKTNSLADIVRTVNRDLRGGREEYLTIPQTRRMVAECLFQYQQSHRPHDLWHFATQDYRSASIWLQLNSGDNRDMTLVADELEEYLEDVRASAADDPDHPVHNISADWFGLTYINVIWQQKMVRGMLVAFGGSFLVVFLLMTVLFRSALWGLLSMVPLTVTIAAIYGAIGLIGKDYDMPVAVLSALTLGLAVDFAIHFLARGRAMEAELGSWEKAAPAVFGEPARAIARNIIVIAAGFLPLLLAPLVPYKTVGALMATILLVGGVATLLLLPALVRLLQRRLFVRGKVMGAGCNCLTCIATSAALVATIALSISSYLHTSWTTLTWVSLAAVPVLAFICGAMSRREKCKIDPDSSQE
ncbi:MAG: efflux RND transporter permease subunit [Phycisphaerae bacterium]